MTPVTTDEKSALRTEIREFADRLERWSLQTLERQVTTPNDHHRIFLLAQGVRISRSFQAVRLLFDAGLNDAAAAVLRALLEQAYVVIAVGRDASLFIVLAKQALVENHKALMGLLKLDTATRPDDLTDDAILAALEQTQSGDGFSAYFWADKAGVLSNYLTMYRRLCTFAHGSMHGASEYLKIGPTGAVVGIATEVNVDQDDCILVAASILLDAVGFASAIDVEAVPSEDLEALSTELRALFSRWHKLEGSTSKFDEIELNSS